MEILRADMEYTLNSKFPLKFEQNEGVDFLLRRAMALLSFQTGLGKTYTACTALKHILTVFPAARGVIICPVKAVKIFKKELKEKLGYKEHEIGYVTNQEMEYDFHNNKIFIFTHTSVEKYGSLIAQLAEYYKLVGIFDEAHVLQDPESKIYQIMGGYIDAETKTRVKGYKEYFKVFWLSTATPILNDLDSLYYIVSFMQKDFFGGKTAFMNRYTKWHLEDIYIKGGRKRKTRVIDEYIHLDELKTKLETICIMRQKKYNLKFAYLNTPITDEEEALYEKVSAGIMGDEKVPFSKRMHDLQRVVDNSYSDEYVGEQDSSKEKLMINTVTEVVKKGFSVVVYVDYHDTVDRLEAVLSEKQNEIGYRKIFKITGKIDLAEREQVEDEIDEKDIIIITSAGSESINLQKANCVIFYDIPFSVKTIIQVIGRVCRVDTKFGYQYIMILNTIGTIDEYKYLLFQMNADLVIRVLGSDANMPMNMQVVDKKNIDYLRDKLIWHYKDVDGKEKRKKKRLLKANLATVDVNGMSTVFGTYFINLNPIDVPNTKKIPLISPDSKDYDEYTQGEIPFTVLRNRYIEKLKTENSKEVLNTLVDTIINQKKIIVLVDNYHIGEILKEFIVNNAKI